MRLYKNYLIATVILFIVEVLIAMYMHDAIIRPFGGDYLVVMLVYCFVKSFINSPVVPTALYVLLFSYLVEISQYFHLVSLLGLQNSKLACTIMGTYFSFVDLLCYTLGVLTIIIIEKSRPHATTTTSK